MKLARRFPAKSTAEGQCLRHSLASREGLKQATTISDNSEEGWRGANLCRQPGHQLSLARIGNHRHVCRTLEHPSQQRVRVRVQRCLAWW